MRLANIRLLTDDFAAADHFYAGQLGLARAYGSADGPYAEYAAGEIAIALFDRGMMVAALGEDPAVAPAGDASVLVLLVDDVDATTATLRDRGARVSEPADRPHWGIRVAHLRDPDGHLVELAAGL